MLQLKRYFRVLSSSWLISVSKGVKAHPVAIGVRFTHIWTVPDNHYLTRTATRYPLPTLQPIRGAKGKASAPKKNAETAAAPATIADLDPTMCNGVNILKNGTDPPIRPDSEYPNWLWGLAEGGESPKPPSQLSPDDKQYWRRYNKVKAHEHNLLKQQSR